MVTSAKISFHWEKVLLEVKTVEAFSYPSGDELKEQVRSLNIHWEIADFVNDEHFVLDQPRSCQEKFAI